MIYSYLLMNIKCVEMANILLRKLSPIRIIIISCIIIIIVFNIIIIVICVISIRDLPTHIQIEELD